MHTISIVSGGFDPIHSGHIEYLKAAKSLASMLVVGANSNQWLINKKGKFFLPIEERLSVISNLKPVDLALSFDDDERGTAKNLILKVRQLYPDSLLIFCNGGDRTPDNIPEMDLVDDNLKFEFGVGGSDKKNSSSWILKQWQNS